MVQSARVQQIVKGDDALLTHQIMSSVAYNAELTRAPVLVASTDSVNFFYPLQDSSVREVIGYPGIPVGSYPTSKFTVAIPGLIPGSPSRGTAGFQYGEGQTVRAEILRLQGSATADLTVDSVAVTGVSDMSQVKVGAIVSGVGVPLGSVVASIDGVDSFSLNLIASATGSAVTLKFSHKETQYMIQEVDILERGFPVSLNDPSGGVNPPSAPLNLP